LPSVGNSTLGHGSSFGWDFPEDPEERSFYPDHRVCSLWSDLNVDPHSTGSTCDCSRQISLPSLSVTAPSATPRARVVIKDAFNAKIVRIARNKVDPVERNFAISETKIDSSSSGVNTQHTRMTFLISDPVGAEVLESVF
jgi:hypothetical protein